MSRRSGISTVYVVEWPDIRAAKIGYSSRRRWRAFEQRGARVLDLIEFETSADAFAFEDACHQVIWRYCAPPFADAREAEPHLGSNGDGWRECYTIPADLTGAESLELIAAHLLMDDA